jgi:hypothetical protein
MSLDCLYSNDTNTQNLGSFVVELMSPKRTTAYKTATTTTSTLKLLSRQTKPTHDEKAHQNSTPDYHNKTSNHTKCSDQKAWTYAAKKEGRQVGRCGKCATALWPQRYSLFLYTLDVVLPVLLGISSKRSKVDRHPRTVAKKKNWGWPIRQLLSLFLFSPSHHHQHRERHCDSIGPVRRRRSTCTHRQAAGVGQHTTTDASIHDTQGPKGRMLFVFNGNE